MDVVEVDITALSLASNIPTEVLSQNSLPCSNLSRYDYTLRHSTRRFDGVAKKLVQ
jgi:hypothetical protein